MKSKGFSVFSMFLVAVLCTTCTKDDGFLTPEGESSALKGAKAVVKVQPSGDVSGVTDHFNINEALQNAGPGDVVQLKEGHFYLHKSLICEDFDGTLKGSGKNKTTIQTAPGVPFDVSECPSLNWPWATVGGHFMICFPHSSESEGGSVTVSDLKIHVTEPATEWIAGNGSPDDRLQAINTHYVNLMGPAPWPGDLTLSDQLDLNVNYINLSIVGEEDSKGFLLSIGLAGFGASSGNFTAKNCDLINTGNGINPHVFCGENSLVTIKNCKIENTGTGSFSFNVTSYDVKGNVIRNVFSVGLQLYSTYPFAPYEVPKNLYSAIKDNSIEMNAFNPSVPAIFCAVMHHVDVYNNIVSGTCGVGITAWGGNYGTCENWSIKDNMFCDLVTTHPSLPEGTTIELNGAFNCEIKNNWNQVVGGLSAADPSNHIGEGIACD
jgi:hypothetical protein